MDLQDTCPQSRAAGIIQERYSELIALTRLYLIQEYPKAPFLESSDAEWSYWQKTLRSPPPQKKPSLPSVRPPAPDSSATSLTTSSQYRQPQREQQSTQTTQLPPKAALGDGSMIIGIKGDSSKDSTQGAPLPTQSDISQSDISWQAKPKENPSRAPLPAPKDNLAEKSAKAKNPAAKNAFTLEPPSAAAPIIDTADIKKLMREQLPHLALIEAIPDDSKARAASADWLKTKPRVAVAVLSFSEGPSQRAFLEQVVQAIAIYGYPAALLSAREQDLKQGWDELLNTPSLSLIIASHHDLQAHPQLAKHYREAAKQGRSYLGPIPLLLLPDPTFYLQEPNLKSTLWNTLKEYLKSAR